MQTRLTQGFLKPLYFSNYFTMFYIFYYMMYCITIICVMLLYCFFFVVAVYLNKSSSWFLTLYYI